MKMKRLVISICKMRAPSRMAFAIKSPLEPCFLTERGKYTTAAAIMGITVSSSAQGIKTRVSRSVPSLVSIRNCSAVNIAVHKR